MSFHEIAELPIFPLPNVVFFPGTVLPLHIFEPRYKQMVSETLEGKGQIAMVLLQPDWEAQYYESPDIYRIGSMGQIQELRRLEEGKYDLQLHGRSRYQIVEILQQAPYRVARVRLLRDRMPSSEHTRALRAEMLSCLKEVARSALSPGEDLTRLEKLDFPTLVNSICSWASVSVYDKQFLLELDDLKVRAESLLILMKRWLGQSRMITQFRHLAPEDPHVN